MMLTFLTRSLLLLLLTVSFFVFTPPAHADNEEVSNCASDAELRADLQDMQNTIGGTLTFACQTNMIITSQLPPITKSTTIDGKNNITLTGLSAVRLFQVNNTGFLKLKNIILASGYGSGTDGGAIYSVGRLDLDHVTIQNSYTSAHGGAIYTTGRIDVAFSKFQDNIGGTGGGAIYASGQNAEVNISGSEFVHNRASAPHPGGAVYATHTLNILSSKFSRNEGGRGGAIYTRRTVAVGSTSIQGSEFFENKTTGVYPNANGAALLIENIKASVTLTEMYDNNGQSGGAIYVMPDGQLELTYSTLRDNTSTNGGGVYNKGSASLESVTLLRNGIGSGHGGGIDNFGTLTLENVTLSGNSATYGAGVKNEGGSATLTNVTLSNNLELNINGGAIFNTGGSTQLYLTNVLVANTSSGPNCKFGQPWVSSEFNISDDLNCGFGESRDGVDLLLAPLADNGGSTRTHLPLYGSPAIDFGADTGLPFDQRSMPRPQGSKYDVGAVEACAKPPQPNLSSPTNASPVPTLSVRLRWQADATHCTKTYVVIVKDVLTGETVYRKGGLEKLKAKTGDLVAHKTYQWFVKAANPGYKKNKSEKWTFTIP